MQKVGRDKKKGGGGERERKKKHVGVLKNIFPMYP